MAYSFAQVASDYYMPLCTGNQAVFETPGTESWWGRATTFTILQTDIIENETYYLQEGKEYIYDGIAPPSIFHFLWLRLDENGDIILKAFSEDLPELSSAIILETPIIYFSHNFLTEEYKLIQNLEPGHDIIDSVISINATFGTYSNCICIRETDIQDDEINNIVDMYFAHGIGKVGESRIYPLGESNTSSMVSTFISGCSNFVDSLPENSVEFCLQYYFDYYITDIQVNTTEMTVQVTWAFQDGPNLNEFFQVYNYEYTGNNVIGLTIICDEGKSSQTFYKNINISTWPLGIYESFENKVSIYPNPTSDVLNFNLDYSTNNFITVNIYHVTGKLVKSVILRQNQEQINVEDLSNGIYMIEIKSDDRTENQKLIIQK